MFARADEESESFDMGDEEWEIATRETPRTFLETDDAGEIRIESWNEEYVLDVEELTLTATRSSSARPSSTAPNDWTRGS